MISDNEVDEVSEVNSKIVPFPLDLVMFPKEVDVKESDVDVGDGL